MGDSDRFVAEGGVWVSLDFYTMLPRILQLYRRCGNILVRVLLVPLGWRGGRTKRRLQMRGLVIGAGEGAERLLLLDQAESPPDVAHRELLRSYPDMDVVPLVADVTDESRIATLEMGDPVRIVDLAENLIRLSGLERRRDRICRAATGGEAARRADERRLAHRSHAGGEGPRCPDGRDRHRAATAGCPGAGALN